MFLTFSADENFGTINLKNFDSAKQKGFRFSVFSLKLANVAIYFLTYKNGKFCWYYRLNLIDLAKLTDYEDIDNAYIKLGEDLLGNNLINFSLIGTDLSGEKKKQRIQLAGEFYKNKCNELENTYSQTFNKCLAYIAIIAFIIPFYFSYLTSLKGIPTIVFVLVIIIVFYLLINSLGLLIGFLKVKTYKFFRESTLYTISDIDITKTLMYFHTSQVLSKKSNYHVSLIKNIEKYIGLIIIIVFSTWVIFFWLGINEDEEVLVKEKVLLHEEIYTFTELQLEVNSEKSFLKANEEELKVLNLQEKNKINQILIFYSNMTPEVLNEQFKAYIDISVNEVEVVFLLDEDLLSGQYKTIVVRSINE